MNRFRKWAIGISLILAFCLLAGGLIVYRLFTWSIPAESGKFQISTLDQPVEIIRDRHAIPHIIAANHKDAARALGFAHAQDRLWHMHVLRMVGQGRLSEMFGSATVDTDIFLQTLDMAGVARRSFASLKPETQAILQAYSEGVNAYIFRETEKLDPGLPPEFLILGVKPEKWEPWQSALILKILDLTLAANMDEEIQRLALAKSGFSPREINNLMPLGPRDNPRPLPDLRTIFGIGTKVADKPLPGKNSLVADRETAGYIDLAFEIGLTASNNWVVSGSRTQTGKPILANDPHLGLTAPSVFYLAHLSFDRDGVSHNVIGGSIPGTPVIIVGRNDHIAWGLTTTNHDAQDLYVERLDPNNDNRYLTPLGSAEFKIEERTIKVSGGEDVTFVRRTTRHGPVLPDAFRKIKTILPPGHVAALRWTALDDGDTSIQAGIDLGLAGSVSEFMQSFESFVSPMQSIVVSDIEGNIGLIAPGKMPVRSTNNIINGRAPSPGWSATYDWEGYLPFAENLKRTNPDSGAFATANANFIPQDYPHYIATDWAEHFRQERVENLIIGDNAKHTIDRSLQVLRDAYSPAMVRLRDAAFAEMASGVKLDSEILAALRNWNGEMLAERPEPLIMMAWYDHLHKTLFEDDLGDVYELFAKGRISRVLNVIENSGARNWCDDLATPLPETCSTIIGRTLDAALKQLKKDYGNDWTQWRWGEAHLAYGEHRPFANVGALAPFFNITVPSSGGPYTLLRGSLDLSKENPYYNRHASAYRAVYDLSDMENSRFMIFGGQSGHFLSAEYDRLTQPWANVEFIPMHTQAKNFRKDAIGTWQLVP